MMKWSVLSTLCLILSIDGVMSCFAKNWKYHSMTELLTVSPVVVYGREIENITVAPDRKDSIFAVSCVMKTDNFTIGPNITIESVWPRTECSDTPNIYGMGINVVVGLRRLENNAFVWDERNPLQSIAFEGVVTALEIIADTCGLQNWVSPNGVNTSTCPICGHPGSMDDPLMTICLDDLLKNDNCTLIPEVNITGECYCGKRSLSNNLDVTADGGGNTFVISVIQILILTLLCTNLLTYR